MVFSPHAADTSCSCLVTLAFAMGLVSCVTFIVYQLPADMAVAALQGAAAFCETCFLLFLGQLKKHKAEFSSSTTAVITSLNLLIVIAAVP